MQLSRQFCRTFRPPNSRSLLYQRALGDDQKRHSVRKMTASIRVKRHKVIISEKIMCIIRIKYLNGILGKYCFCITHENVPLFLNYHFNYPIFQQAKTRHCITVSLPRSTNYTLFSAGCQSFFISSLRIYLQYYNECETKI